MPEVSVVIVNWNTKDLLLACVKSLKTNTHRTALEIIVVDNASTDGSQDALMQAFPDVRLIQNSENLGFAKANNIGIRACSGAYVCLVNSDVEVKSGCIDQMKQYLDAHADVGMAGPKIYLPDGTIQQSCKKFPTLWNRFCSAVCLHRLFRGVKFFASSDTWYGRYDESRNVDVLIGAFWFVRRRAIDEVGLLDEGFYFYSEDLDWCKRFWEKRWRIVFHPEPEIIHYTGGSSKHAPVNYYLQLQRANLQYWKKHHTAGALVVAKGIMLLHQLVRILFGLITYGFFSRNKANAQYKIKRSFAALCWLLTGGL